MLRNVHERTIDAPASSVGALLDQLGSSADPLWPAPTWAELRLDAPLAVGADGGHGSVRYQVSEYQPGRRVRFTFNPATGIEGFHELAVEPVDERSCRIRHVLIGQSRGAMRVLVPLAMERLHDALIEDLFDNAERAATGTVREPARWSAWVRLWWHLTEPGEKRRGRRDPAHTG